MFPLLLAAQLPLSNHGGLISVKNGAFMSIHGDAINTNDGLFHNSDTIYLFEDWVNDAGNEAFSSVGEGVVILKNEDQRIRGLDTTRFYDLRMEGTGIKYGDLGVFVDGFLRLNDREFNLDTNAVHVFNTDLDAVNQQGGFVSSLEDGGLLRHTANTQTYSFPVGSSLGTTRFRPIDLTLSSASPNVFKLRMANVDATTENFDRENRDSIICEINPAFYHRIYQMQGIDSALVKIHYDAATDGAWDSIAHWQNDPKWEVTGGVATGINASYNLEFLASNNYISDYTFPAFALATISDSIDLRMMENPVCEGETHTFVADGGFLNYDFYTNDVLVQSGTDSTYTSIMLDGDQVYVVAQDDDCTYFSRPVTAEVYMNEILLTASETAICFYDSVIVTATPGFLNYDYQVNGITVQSGPFNTYIYSMLNNGDVLTVVGTDANCDYKSDPIVINVFQNQVDLSVDNFIACEGETFTFTATTGFNTYDFQVNGVTVQNGASNIFASPLGNFDDVQVIATDNHCDYPSNIIEVTIYQNTLGLVADTLILCEGETFTFTATSGYNNYDFYINNTLSQSGAGNVFATNSLGNGDVVFVEATDDNCTFESNAITVGIYQNSINLTANALAACEGDSFTFTATPGFNNYEFFVNFTSVQSGASNTYTTSTLSDGATIMVRGTDDNCVYDSEPVVITIYSNSIQLTIDDTLACEGQTLNFTASQGFNQYEFFLNGQSVQVSPSDVYTNAMLSQGDTLSVIGTDDNCDYRSNEVVVNILNASVFVEASASGVCDGEAITFTATSGFDSYDFYWNETLAQSNSSNQFSTNNLLDGDSIQVFAYLESCEFQSNTLSVSVYPIPQIIAYADTAIYYGVSASLNVEGGAFYTWSPSETLDCDDCEQPTATPDSTTLYTVWGESLEGCIDTASVLVTILSTDEDEVKIPNAFTPNGDGTNDTWHISYLDAFPENEVTVLNRYGDILYNEKPYIEEFNGMYQGKALPRGTYYYILTVVVNGQTQIFKGPLTIVR